MKIVEQIGRLREILSEAKIGDGREEAEEILAQMLRAVVTGEDYTNEEKESEHA